MVFAGLWFTVQLQQHYVSHIALVYAWITRRFGPSSRLDTAILP
jgi:hypothetical protein